MKRFTVKVVGNLRYQLVYWRGFIILSTTFNESDESVVDRWIENPYWQYFCGFEQMQHQCPLHPTSLTKWRNRVGDKLELLLEEILTVAIETKALKPHAFKHVNVDHRA
ncbi:MAG: transposase [Cycloclasticus sp.]|nr:transposase [Cycloclasticus sp.]